LWRFEVRGEKKKREEGEGIFISSPADLLAHGP
jgi:hypothetical protein